MKKIGLILLVSCFLIAILLDVFVFGGSITKGVIGKQDIYNWDGATSTFTRTASGGYTLTLNKIDWPGVDVLQVYGGGVNRTKATLSSALTGVGAVNKVRFFLSPGEWAITADLTITSNVTLYVPPGASLAVSVGKTLTIQGPIEAGPYQIFSGAGTVTISSVILEHDQWRDGAGNDILPSTDNSIDVGSSTQEIKDIYVDGTAYLDTITGDPLPGYLSRSKFEWKDGDEIYINPGMYQHNGTANQLVYWNSQITFELEAAGSNALSDDYGADGWHYIYLDDSAIVTQASPLLDADCFLNETTAPSYSVTKHGWYNGLDRCIFAVYETGGAILEFLHDGGDLVTKGEATTDYANADPGTDFSAEVTLVIPAFVRQAKCTFAAIWVDGAPGNHYWRNTDSSVATGHLVSYLVDDQDEHSIVVSDVSCNSSLKIDIRCGAGDNDTILVYTNGWYFPNGM